MEKDRNDKNIGKKLEGRYEIVERIGEGGMADVYRANDVVDGKPVAVKILKKEFAENEEFLRRFRNESKATALLNHPNIVKIYDVGFSDRIQFIVMEYIDGITLNEYIEQSDVLDWRDAVHFVTQILRALQHAHSKGIVHRDIKPQNIMMLRDGTIKVMDFGIAKFAREEGKTGTDKAIGTVHYISPEQARGAATDAKSDLYSVGVMLYEMLTGKKPFDHENPVSVAVMHMQADPKRPRSIRADIAPGLEEIILKAMQKDPADRYQSARDMMDDLESFKENTAIVFGYIPNLEDSPASADSAKAKFSGAVVTEPSEAEDPRYAEEDDEDDQEDEDDDEDEYEYEEEERPSVFVPIITAVICVVITIAVIIGVKAIIDFMNNQDNPNNASYKMPSLVGMDYEEAKQQYGQLLQIEVESYEYSTLAKDKIFDQSIPAEDPVEKGTTVKVKVSKGSKKITLPDYTNWDYVTTKQQIINLGLTIDERYTFDDTVEQGKIVRTDPAPNSELEPGDYVTVYVSKGKNKNTVPVPNFIGMSYETALDTAAACNLELVRVEDNSNAPKGQIFHQSINPTEPVTEGTTITVKVSNGIPAEQNVEFSIAIPEKATGSFHIIFYEGGVVHTTGPSFNVAYATGTTKVSLSGTGTVDFLVRLVNDSNMMNATIGTYKVDFDNRTVTVIESDVEAAFAAVRGLVVETTTTTTTTTTSSAAPDTTTTTTVVNVPDPVSGDNE
ncbi:MAG: Stk1 family PASTA domain-containing Ser/Thr kinase [Oscillospiraceae bacterium]|nr:Stk1 family PASTA domain-containing Ser/Thr kinase [Oscillospiraceae bacterium]